VGCHSCEIACAVAHSASKELVGALREEVRSTPRLSVEAADGVLVVRLCHQCENAPCVAACRKKALVKSGPKQAVVLNEALCVGCKLCVKACPFGAIKMGGRNGKVAVKCDLCVERQAAGQGPACVAACKTRALRFLTVEEIRAMKRRAAEETVAAGKK
jgi:carbon-monoxide dehydrogenase iron sulfur subunit